MPVADPENKEEEAQKPAPVEPEFDDEDDVTSPTPCCGGGPHKH